MILTLESPIFSKELRLIQTDVRGCGGIYYLDISTDSTRQIEHMNVHTLAIE
jgi:hypothetical protein